MTFQLHVANPHPLGAPDTTMLVSSLGIDPEYVISRDKEGKVLSQFKHSTWDLRVYGAPSAFHFDSWWDAKTRGPMDKLANLIRVEIKTFCWLSLFETTANSGRSRGISYVTSLMIVLRAVAKLAHVLNLPLSEAEGSSQFQVRLRSSIENLDEGFSSSRVIKALLKDAALWHQLPHVKWRVPRLVPEADLSTVLILLQKKSLKALDKQESRPLIPTRLFGKIISGARDQLKSAEPHLQNLELLLIEVFADPSLCVDGRQSYENNANRVLKLYPFRVLQTWEGAQWQSLSYAETLERFGLTGYAEQKELVNLRSIIDHITHLQVLCAFLIHAFSGMRKSEVLAMPYESVVHCAAKGFGDLPVFVSHLQKFTQRANYSRPLVWATSDEGIYASRIAQKLSRLIWFCDNPLWDDLPANVPLFIGRRLKKEAPQAHYSLPMMRSLYATENWRGACKSLQLFIEEEDLKELRTFDAFRAWDENPDFAVGKLWPLTSHQFRRSVAVYASRSGMVSLPTLKTQFKHLSEVMTGLYSENSTYAQNFLIDENGKPIDDGSVLTSFRDAVAFNTSVRFHEQVINSERPLRGPIGADIQRAKTTNSLPLIFKNREETQMAVKQGRFSFKDTPVGGCVLKGSCPHFAIDLVLPCTTNCEHAILKPEKLETYIESLRFDLETLSPKSRPYQLIAREIDFIESTYLKPAEAEQ